ncbi:hypothetical protein B9S64_03840 [Streptomyces sp. SM18]|nr:hypothetical protein B9S64_03840 [Streptomyces sp. SM18]
MNGSRASRTSNGPSPSSSCHRCCAATPRDRPPEAAAPRARPRPRPAASPPARPGRGPGRAAARLTTV